MGSSRGVARLVEAAAAGDLTGTFPSADLAARIATRGTVDLRQVGSGNPGAANAIQILGPRFGYAVLAADIAKGAAACGAGAALAGGSGSYLAGTAAVVGHCYPVWSGFHGGKGVGTSVGQCLATFPVYVPIDLLVVAVTAASPVWKRRSFAATVVASACWVAGSVVWWRRRWPNLWGPRPSVGLPLSTAASSAVIVWRFVSARAGERALAARTKAT